MQRRSKDPDTGITGEYDAGPPCTGIHWLEQLEQLEQLDSTNTMRCHILNKALKFVL